MIHALPTSFRPAVDPADRSHAQARPFNHPAWLFEPKYDGFRGMLHLTRSGCNLYSKRGNLMTRFAGLARQVAGELGARELILDGEIVSLDDEGRIEAEGRELFEG